MPSVKDIKLNKEEILKIGDFLSGVGFWKSVFREKADNKLQKKAENAWIEYLREKGFSDIDIALFGDWRYGRDYSDKLVVEEAETKEEMKEYLSSIIEGNNVKYSEVKEENRKNYSVFDVIIPLSDYINSEKEKNIEKAWVSEKPVK